MRFLGLAFVAGLIGVAGVAGAITLRGGSDSTEVSGGNVVLRQAGNPVTGPSSSRSRAPRQLAPTPAPIAATEPVIAVAEPAPPAHPVAAPSVERAGSVLGPGRTTLADSIFAVRSGDTVVVNFDTKGNRTRRADKFEGMVRLTLPMVYGRRVAPALDSIPEGSLLPSRDVIGSLTSQGLHLLLDNGVKIGLWPQTRESLDGPLVVAYLVVVER